MLEEPPYTTMLVTNGDYYDVSHCTNLLDDHNNNLNKVEYVEVLEEI